MAKKASEHLVKAGRRRHHLAAAATSLEDGPPSTTRRAERMGAACDRLGAPVGGDRRLALPAPCASRPRGRRRPAGSATRGKPGAERRRAAGGDGRPRTELQPVAGRQRRAGAVLRSPCIRPADPHRQLLYRSSARARRRCHRQPAARQEGADFLAELADLFCAADRTATDGYVGAAVAGGARPQTYDFTDASCELHTQVTSFPAASPPLAGAILAASPSALRQPWGGPPPSGGAAQGEAAGAPFADSVARRRG